MDSRTRLSFLVLVLIQVVHSLEEYAFGFFDVFPPARYLGELLPGWPRIGFIVFNSVGVAFGFWCYLARLRPDHSSARLWSWVWVTIELYNGIAHAIWALAIGGYNPGLATAPGLFVVSFYLAILLRRNRETV